MAEEEILYLFSSNIRPLYEQDILDVIAAPKGAHYQFRYARKYIHRPEAWDEGLEDATVLVNFSLQQENKYHDPVFIPVRTGTVVGSKLLGRYHVVTFRLGDHLALRMLPDGGKSLARGVKAYTEALKKLEIPLPDDYAASFGPDVRTSPTSWVDLDPDRDEVDRFDAITTYLQGTRSFRDAKFFRFLSLKEQTESSGDGDSENVSATEGVFELTAGKTYDLEILHSQPTDVVGRHRFEVSVDGQSLVLIGPAHFEVASRYDVVTVPIHVAEDPERVTHQTTLMIHPAGGVQGPAVRIPVRIVPPWGKHAGAVAVTTLGLVLVGLPGLIEASGLVKLASLAAGGLIAGTASVFGLRRLVRT